MPVTKRDLDWLAADLLPEIHNQNRKSVRVNHRLNSLLNELKPMKFRITEDVFFFGRLRKAGEVMEAPVGPYKSQPGAGGLKRIPQFVELPHEIQVTEQTQPEATPLPTVTMAPATDKVTSSVTGAGHAALSIKQMMADGKTAIATAHQHVLEQAGKLNKAAAALQGLGDDLGSEADDLLAAIGQFKNDLGV